MSHPNTRATAGAARLTRRAASAPAARRAESRPVAAAPGDATSRLQILIVDDDRLLREGCSAVLTEDGHVVASTDSGERARELLAHRRFDVAIVDVNLAPVSGMELLRGAVASTPEMLVVMITADPSVQASIEARTAGAWEFLPKPFTATHLRMVVGHAAHVIASRSREHATIDELLQAADDVHVPTPLGGSASFRGALAAALQVATTDASVALVGESGTGKEVMARYIHAHSRRAAKPFVAINCAALPEPLLESEMFGHRKGAFTGADRDKPGLLETAHEGTLFLDEVTEMSPAIQAKLLRVLQDGRVRRVGSEDEGTRVDVRIITATNRDPHAAVASGRLRHDLFFRLWVFPIALPPLRERPDDVQRLAPIFLGRYWSRHRRTVEAPTLSDDALTALSGRWWPGNVRELQNLMERLAVTVSPSQTLRACDLPPEQDLRQVGESDPSAAIGPLLQAPLHKAREQLLQDFERTYLRHLVTRAGSNLSRAARLAEIDRTTLYRLMLRHGLRVGEPLES